MPDYVVRFIGHTIRGLQPDFPAEVFYDLVTRVDSLDRLRKETNNQILNFVKQGGMVVMPNRYDILEINDEGNDISIDKRWYIPMHMISHIETKTVMLDCPIPDKELVVS